MIKSLLKYFYVNLLIDRVSQIICRNHFLKKHVIINCLCSASWSVALLLYTQRSLLQLQLAGTLLSGSLVTSFAFLHTEVSGVAAPLSIVAAGGIPALWFPGRQLCFSTHRGLWGRCSTLHSCSWRDPCSLVPWSVVTSFASLHTEVSGVAAPLSIVAASGIPVLWFPSHQLCFPTHRGLWGRSSTLRSCSWRDPCTPALGSPEGGHWDGSSAQSAADSVANQKK